MYNLASEKQLKGEKTKEQKEKNLAYWVNIYLDTDNAYSPSLACFIVKLQLNTWKE